MIEDADSEEELLRSLAFFKKNANDSHNVVGKNNSKQLLPRHFHQ